jgi:predicted RNA-binding Zn ribbon-like protein
VTEEQIREIGRGPGPDLANTIVRRPGGEVDLLTTAGGLAAWLRAEEPWLGEAPAETALRLADFRALRDAVRSAFGAASAGGPVPGDAVRSLNAASAGAPSVLGLDATDPTNPVAVARTSAGSRTAELLAAIARSAIEIVGGPDRSRLHVCGAPRCGRYFLASRAGRLWCTDACGNRARVARHERRRRDAGRGDRPHADPPDAAPTLRA